jgi:hypothetical protein
MASRTEPRRASVGPRIGRRGFLGTLGIAAGIAALPQVAAAWSATAPVSADAAGTHLNAWDIHSFTLSYPRYAEAIPHPRRRAAPVIANRAGAEPLDELFRA